MKELIKKSIFAGLLIGFAGWLFINTENKIIGSILFGIGLISVIIFQANLFTGKIGYVNSRKSLCDCGIILISNIVPAYLFGYVHYLIYGENSIWLNKLNKSYPEIILGATICGICIFLAVELYKQTKSLLLVILPVVAFILAGGNHCVADAFYMGASGTLTIDGIIMIIIIAAWNSIGSLVTRWFSKQ